ncbi:DUF4097 family beta strand repeat-containing protein [Pseudonocardia hispaniensis]|uniref:DUF4097 family beta strand repeat-containing protein n=1 Tax=Pseudonocardia hispaniensis TaxID=904933 RepID=A0ABW1IX92_9PSEU
MNRTWVSALLLSVALLLTGCGGAQVGPRGSDGSDRLAGTSATSGSDGSVRTESGSQRYDQAISRVEIDSDAGDVELRSGPDGAAQVERTLRWTDERPTVTESVDGDVLRITARCPDGPRIGRCEVALTVTAPAAVSVRTKLGAGGITVDDLTGDQDLATSAGRVHGAGLRGATVRAQSSAGGVELAFAAAPQQVEVRATAGDVTVRVPATEAYRVQARSTAGTVRVNVADDPGATRTILARTTAGDVTVTAS